MSSDGQTAGFYGKIPALGDFVGRRLTRDFVTPWDDWLQLSMAASRSQLGDAWLDTYLTSPLWRFTLSAGVCGSEPFAGVMMPSVDRVGRYFPLVLAAALPAGTSLPGVAGHREWFAGAESLLLSTLDDEGEFELDAFDQGVAALGVPPTAPVETDVTAGGGTHPLRLQITDADDLDGRWAAFADLLAHRFLGDYSLWWTAGSQQVVPSLLLYTGLPAPENFAAMLDGVWDATAPAASTHPAPVQPQDGAPMILDAGFPEEPV